MPGFPGRAESEGRKSGHELIRGEGCLSTLGRDGAWVGWDTWVLFRVIGWAGSVWRSAENVKVLCFSDFGARCLGAGFQR